jgi:PQQ-like domain
MLRLGLLAAAVLVLSSGAANSATAPTSSPLDWPMFGYTPARSNQGAAATGITAANVAHLRRREIHIDGTVDSSAIYLHGALIGGAKHDTIFFTTTYGKTEAVDAKNGKVLWRFTPPDYSSYAGSAQITVMTPLADPAGNAIYAGAPDGVIRKLNLANGKQLWATTITKDPTHEKLAGSINLWNGLVLAATDGYIGDAPPYQGHIVSMQASNGHIVGVFNSLCSNRHGIIQPSTCTSSDSAFWGRSVPVVDPSTGDILGATGNAPFDGVTNWGDSVVMLTPDAKKLLKHWTPATQSTLNTQDLDLGATAPALLSGGYVVQGGKDGELRLLSIARMAPPNPTTGGELQTLQLPGHTDLFAEPAVWNGTRVFLANAAGTQAWALRGGRLHAMWSNGNDGTSPVIAGGLLYIQGSAGIRVYNPANGSQLAVLPIGETHWESPIVVDGRVISFEGSSNDHNASSGILDVYVP